jgi:hypothetical protein
MASILVMQDRIGEAEHLLAGARAAIDAMESNELRARYLAVDLQCCVKKGVDDEQIRERMDLCEALRPRISEVKVALDLDAELFKSAIAIGDVSEAATVFDRYYAQVRSVVSNLPNEYASDYVRHPQLTEILELYRQLKTQDPGQR